jgi:hypothetical protein
MRKTTHTRFTWPPVTCVVFALLVASCLPKPPAEGGDITITLYGFSIMKESLEKAIFPGFINKWKQLHGQEVRFQSSYAGGRGNYFIHSFRATATPEMTPQLTGFTEFTRPKNKQTAKKHYNKGLPHNTHTLSLFLFFPSC